MNENRYIKIVDVPLSVTTVQLSNALAAHVDNGNANSSNGNTNKNTNTNTNTNAGNKNMEIYMSPVIGATTNNLFNKNTTAANGNEDDNGIIATTVSTDYSNGNGGNGDSYKFKPGSELVRTAHLYFRFFIEEDDVHMDVDVVTVCFLFVVPPLFLLASYSSYYYC